MMTMEKGQSHSRRMDTSQLGNGEKIPLHLTRTGPPKQTKKEANVKTEVTGKPPQNPRQNSVSISREANGPPATHQKCQCNPPEIPKEG